jgi:hypothetical protein
MALLYIAACFPGSLSTVDPSHFRLSTSSACYAVLDVASPSFSSFTAATSTSSAAASLPIVSATAAPLPPPPLPPLELSDPRVAIVWPARVRQRLHALFSFSRGDFSKLITPSERLGDLLRSVASTIPSPFVSLARHVFVMANVLDKAVDMLCQEGRPLMLLRLLTSVQPLQTNWAQLLQRFFSLESTKGGSLVRTYFFAHLLIQNGLMPPPAVRLVLDLQCTDDEVSRKLVTILQSMQLPDMGSL